MINSDFRSHFPFFKNEANWVYLDSAATTLKPQVLIDETMAFYQSAGSVHRSQYDLAQTEAYEMARDLVVKRFNVESRNAVIWTSGTTHAINLVANGLSDEIKAGDDIIVSVAEHHANFIPWQQLAERKKANLIVLPVDENYYIDINRLSESLSSKTKIVAFNLVSNVTGVRQPVEKLIPIIREKSSAKILLDMAQAVNSEQIDIQQLDADFYAFSAHKMYGPTGVGVLTGKLQSLATIRPLFFGGKMLTDISEQKLILAELPYRLEAGTPNIAGIISFGKVLAWLEQWDLTILNNSLYQLAGKCQNRLQQYANIQILKSNVITPTISFNFSNHHHADIATILTEQKIALRTGEHCAKPYLRYLEKTGTLRISLAHYNTGEDITRFFNALDMTLQLLED
ncbi:aminotransferase class V-fold PLP-dependent enzyme [Otariodibacter oris]|uniref:cysteine desulfurase n=1 Tax=Otariodibacter oris TaxID=1032623 RepID=A0A420XEK3_9PAST|nr:cysteine desulfurase [Otariodibacter oris]QGM81435.1 cysteine desulfurase [Otariodibacter oris]RKR70750.1 cysteine sulfinate desulfinase [Otariodibacter oris]